MVSHELEYNMANIPAAKHQRRRGRQGTFYTVVLTLTLTPTPDGLQSSLKCDEIELNTGGEVW